MLFDRIGIRRQVLETDPYGNFLLTGYDYGTARPPPDFKEEKREGRRFKQKPQRNVNKAVPTRRRGGGYDDYDE